MVNLLLTDQSIRAIALPQSGQVDYFDTSLAGFAIRVSPQGTKAFFLLTGKKNNRRRQGLGRYGIISLSQARAVAKKRLAELTLGIGQDQTITFSEALKIFGEQKYPTLKPRTVKDYKGIFARHFSKKLGDYKLAAIRFEDVTAITDKLVKTPVKQKHALVVCGTFFRWCVRRRYLKHNPLEGADIPKRPARKRVLSDDELVKVWRAADNFTEPFRSIVLLLILTGQRRVEVSSLHKTWVSHNQQTVTLPDTITKNKREHVVPLGPMALAVLGTSTPDDYYFVSGRTDGKTLLRVFQVWRTDGQYSFLGLNGGGTSRGKYTIAEDKVCVTFNNNGAIRCDRILKNGGKYYFWTRRGTFEMVAR